MLGNDVHSYLAKVEVGADAGGSRDAGFTQHMSNHATSQFMGRYLVCSQVVGDVHEHLVDRVDMDVLRGYVFQVYAVDTGAIINIVGHARRRHQIAQGLFGVRSQVTTVGGLALQLIARGIAPPLGVDLPHALHYLEQPRTTADTIGLERRRYCQADGFLRSAGVGHHQIGSQWVEAPLHALYRGVERLEVDGNICAVGLHGWL